MSVECEILERAVKMRGEINCREICKKDLMCPFVDDVKVIPDKKGSSSQGVSDDASPYNQSILQLIRGEK